MRKRLIPKNMTIRFQPKLLAPFIPLPSPSSWSCTSKLAPHCIISFFLTKRTGQAQGEELGRMKPLFKASSNCFLSSASSRGAILYGLLAIGTVPGTRSITNSTSLSSGIPGSSSGKTSGKSRTTGMSSSSGRGLAFREWSWHLATRVETFTISPEGWVSWTFLE